MTQERQVILEARGLSKTFLSKEGLFKKHRLTAVDSLSFPVINGETFAVVGESGSGKTTLAMLLTRLLNPDAGEIRFEQRDVFSLDKAGLRAFRRSVQMVFQDPFASLDPRFKIGHTIAEGMIIHRLGSKPERERRVFELLELVGLPTESYYKYPHEFSGGQRQRICIARALAVEPRLIVADEPVSALDVSVQSKILNLLADLKKKKALTYIIIAHNLRMVAKLAETVAVMYLGRIVELAPASSLFAAPFHPYTKLLLQSIPSLGLKPNEQPLVPQAETAPEVRGCRFRNRCPESLAMCSESEPELKKVGEGRLVACHLY